MTKPANFPERRRQRQIGALERLSFPEKWMTSSRQTVLAHERKVLADAVNEGSQAGVRTKRGLHLRARPSA